MTGDEPSDSVGKKGSPHNRWVVQLGGPSRARKAYNVRRYQDQLDALALLYLLCTRRTALALS
jgi:hypothetical protein